MDIEYRLANLKGHTDYQGQSPRIMSFTETKDCLVKVCESIFTDNMDKGQTITEFVIGKTYIDKGPLEFDVEYRSTWDDREKGIESRLRYYEKKGYTLIVVIAAISEELIPKQCSEIQFQYGNQVGVNTGARREQQHTESKKRKTEPKLKEEREFKIDKEIYTLGLEQALIHHFMFVEPDSRIRNHSFNAGGKWGKTSHEAGVIYVALKQSDDTDEGEEEGNESNDEVTSGTSAAGNIGDDDNKEEIKEDEEASTSSSGNIGLEDNDEDEAASTSSSGNIGLEDNDEDEAASTSSSGNIGLEDNDEDEAASTS